MTSREFRDRLARRAGRLHDRLPRTALDGLEAYYFLLAKWNAKINLTALPLDRPTDETFDRLLIEPLAAARLVPDRLIHWTDLGSGGGSPAIPLRILKPASRLTMVESKTRKVAFLREAVRAIGLQGTEVEDARYEEVARSRPGSADFITVRAVRVDARLAGSAAELLSSGGQLMLFRPAAKALAVGGFVHVETSVLVEALPSYASVYARAFHVEH